LRTIGLSLGLLTLALSAFPLLFALAIRRQLFRHRWSDLHLGVDVVQEHHSLPEQWRAEGRRNLALRASDVVARES
jgi:hypothetical protein